MSLRLLELVLPEGEGKTLDEWLADEVTDLRHSTLHDGRSEFKLLTSSTKTEALLDKLESRYGHLQGFRVTVLRVELTLPEEAEPEPLEVTDVKPVRTVSRQELLGAMARDTKVTSTYITMVVLSVVVASIGLIYDNVAVLIAAMIIAPLLGANMALALATTTGDGQLARNALKVNATGVSIAMAMSVALGLMLPQGALESAEITSRTQVRLSDFALALAAGAAGTLSFTSGVSGTLIGVMVAVALMPPLIVVGMMVGAGNLALASGALMLLATNLICLNLAGVLTFFVQGVRPRQWWAANRAKKATRIAVCGWVVMLLLLVGIVMLIKYQQGFASLAPVQ